MAKLAGKNLRVRWHDGTTYRDISSDGMSVTVPLSYDEVEATGYTDAAHNFILGLAGMPITLEGFANPAATTGLHTIFAAAVGAATARTLELTVGQNAAATTGDPRITGLYVVSQYNFTPELAGAHKASVTLALGQTTAPAWSTASSLNP